MVRRPTKLSERPRTLDLENPRGDVLADLLGVSLLTHALYKPIECGAPWGLRVPSKGRAMFYLVARGSALLEVDGERPCALSAGDVAILAHGTAHTLRDAPTTKPVPVCDGKACGGPKPRRVGGGGAQTSLVAGFFELGARPPPLLESMPRLLTVSATDPTAPPQLSTVVQLIVRERASPGPASAIVLQRLADVLFVNALRAASLRADSCRHGGLAALNDPAMRDALALIHGHVDVRWSVASLAARVGMSRSGFAARFTELVGEPPLQYLARWRMSRAAELLRDTRDGVAQIASRVGYESVPSFTKAFKRWQGESPGAFRRRHARRSEAAADSVNSVVIR
jgi:AraC-like DNA-binding protein